MSSQRRTSAGNAPLLRASVLLLLVALATVLSTMQFNATPRTGSIATDVPPPVAVLIATPALVVPPTPVPSPTVAPTPTAVAVGTPASLRGVSAALNANIPFPSPSPVMDADNGPLRTNRLVTFYGQPDSPGLGVLGGYSPTEMIRRLKAQAAAYTAIDPAHPAIPTIELIASVASDTPGKDGLYLNPTRPELIAQYVQLAEDNGCYVLLDVQLGYDTVTHEVQRLLPYLAKPHVHLAIDPEFHVKRGERPGESFGSLSAAEANEASKMLAALVVERGITDKILLIHQFRDDMLPDKGKITRTPHVQLVINMDGFGPPDSKITNYQKFVRDEPLQYGGIKIFYKQDKPLMPPEQVLALVPAPLIVNYQ